ncbi:MAG: M56 family metallopeptidase [Eubacteriales bacterium]
MFLQVLNMTFVGSFVILFVLVARLLLKKAPKKYSYLLWIVVLFRLIVPFSVKSVLSLIPVNPTPIVRETIYSATPQITNVC